MNDVLAFIAFAGNAIAWIFFFRANRRKIHADARAQEASANKTDTEAHALLLAEYKKLYEIVSVQLDKLRKEEQELRTNYEDLQKRFRDTTKQLEEKTFFYDQMSERVRLLAPEDMRDLLLWGEL